MSNGNREVESYDDWAAAMRTAELRPLHKWRLQEMFEATCRYGSGNCWTGTSGKLAEMIRQLLAERERILSEHEGTKVARENNN